MKLALSTIIILITTSHAANDNKTSTETTNSKAHQNVTTEPRQSGYGLIKFEGQTNPNQDVGFDDTNPHSLVTFDDQPSNKPFRFENQQVSYENEPNYQHQEFGVRNPGYKEEETGYGFYHPVENAINEHSFANEDPNIDKNPQYQSGYGLVFQDDNGLENGQNQKVPGQKKKRRRRRRKPKQLPASGYGFGPGGSVRPGQGIPVRPGPLYPAPLPGGQFHRPPRSRPSIAEEALVSITSALTSIARYDDYQCVPRLLCEVAGGQNPVTGSGSGGSGAGGVLQTIVNLQPLVTLLAAYNGVSTSPLFVFGRAAILGMTSKGNAGTCRYAYPQCPTDPEKLVEYLNNHNGGFFRFFNNPQPYGEQNLEQFYSQLSGNYGIYQPQSGPAQNGFPVQNYGGYPIPTAGGYPQDNSGYPNGLYPNQYQQIPGLYPGIQGPGYPGYGYQNLEQLNGYHPNGIGGVANQNPSSYQGYGFQNPAPGQNYGLYHGSQHKYGYKYPYQRGKFKSAEKGEGLKNEIEKRIQNRPDIVYVGGESELNGNRDTKWTFPNSNRCSNENVKQKQRFQRTVVFPEKEDANSQHFTKGSNVETSYVQQNMDFNRKAKGFNFPENQSNRQYIDYYDYPPYTQTQVLGDKKFKLDEQGFYVESNEDVDFVNQDAKGYKENEDGVELVYVLRGNGDPNKPEIVKLKPGQKLQ